MDIERVFPELVALRGTATRLHPRAGVPGAEESSVGGPPLWPSGEPWPRCIETHYGPDGLVAPPEGSPLVPVVQLYRRDVPAVAFPDGTDLMQVLWCPFEHEQCEPAPRVYWRSSVEVGSLLEARPVPEGAEPRHVPQPCTVHPEQVVEYPSSDLPRDLFDLLLERFNRLEAETGWDYWSELSVAEGIKCGGYPGWTQDPQWSACPQCDGPMEHLLTIASWEYSGSAWRAWLPVEDQTVVDGQATCGETGKAAQAAHGLMLGDAGGVYIFECRACPECPTARRFDCS
ncbi:DUF1963 domain-containing protein [Streptomyces sp. NPDC007162]|uniref:DUF1963 domain-containing protein n=1 Tax=Streptomyces sp. NPDC007162 TaxID=3156917 RepID=UPI0033F612B5